MLLISRHRVRHDRLYPQCFNLVIEMLLISSTGRWPPPIFGQKFQSRNRDAFDFKIWKRVSRSAAQVFSFNLVIEMLLISRKSYLGFANGKLYCFNLVIEMLLISRGKQEIVMFNDKVSFNLVIEMLLISSGYPHLHMARRLPSFNLVIEMLLISSLATAYRCHFPVLVSIS